MKLFRCILAIAALAGALTLSTALPASAAPAITSFTPTANGNTGSTVMTINGSGFVSGAKVALVQSPVGLLETPYVANAASVAFASASQLVATFAAAERPGTYAVRVTNPDNSTITSGSLFTLLGETPVVDGISPTKAQRGTSPTLTITGANLSRGADWEFLDIDDSALTSNISVDTITVDSPTQVRLAITIPTGSGANPPGVYTLQVTNADGKTDTGCCFTTENPPAAAVAPVPSSVDPGTASNTPSNTAVAITVEGEDFDTDANPAAPDNNTRAQLVMGGYVIPVDDATVTQGDGLITPDSLSGTVDLAGEAPGSYDVVLFNPDDGGTGTLADAFTVAATGAPTITSFQQVTTTSGGTTLGSPTTKVTIPAGANRTYVVNGDHFAKGDAVSSNLSGLTATSVEVLSKTQLRVTLQAAATASSADHNLRVTHTDGQFGACSGCVHVDGRDRRWLLSNRVTSPTTQIQFTFGVEADRFLVCDWDGNGTDTPAIRRGNTWVLSNKADGTGPLTTFSWARSTDVPICGDWNADGKDTVGVRRGNTWFLKSANNGTTTALTFAWAAATDTPVVGDWNGDGKDTVGVRRGNTWYLKNANSNAAHDIAFAWARSSDVPLVGDWNGDRIDTVGVRRGTTFYLKSANSSATDARSVTFGLSTDKPVTGDYDGNRTSTVGVVRVI